MRRYPIRSERRKKNEKNKHNLWLLMTGIRNGTKGTCFLAFAERMCFIIPAKLQSGKDEIRKVTGNRTITAACFPRIAACSNGVTPHCNTDRTIQNFSSSKSSSIIIIMKTTLKKSHPEIVCSSKYPSCFWLPSLSFSTYRMESF